MSEELKPCPYYQRDKFLGQYFCCCQNCNLQRKLDELQRSKDWYENELIDVRGKLYIAVEALKKAIHTSGRMSIYKILNEALKKLEVKDG